MLVGSSGPIGSSVDAIFQELTQSRFPFRASLVQFETLIGKPNIYSWLVLGQLARATYESMRREASCLKIQKNLRMHLARKAYTELCSSAISIQAGMRGMAARNELRLRRQIKAAIVIQVTLYFFIFHVLHQRSHSVSI